jgi:hypothetical protein
MQRQRRRVEECQRGLESSDAGSAEGLMEGSKRLGVTHGDTLDSPAYPVFFALPLRSSGAA